MVHWHSPEKVRSGDTKANDAPGYDYAKQARISTERRADSPIALPDLPDRRAFGQYNGNGYPNQTADKWIWTEF
jgi:hypothetical protein